MHRQLSLVYKIIAGNTPGLLALGPKNQMQMPPKSLCLLLVFNFCTATKNAKKQNTTKSLNSDKKKIDRHGRQDYMPA